MDLLQANEIHGKVLFNSLHNPASPSVDEFPISLRNKSSETEEEDDRGDNCCLPPLLEDMIRISLGYLVGAALTGSLTDIIKVGF